jgi:murein DD-endopeptidase MepM/ murein hydrolase activator NlpD
LDVIDDLVDIFGPRVDFRRDLQPGDTYTVVFKENRLSDGTYISSGDISLAAIVNNGKMLSAIQQHSNAGSDLYFDENGQAIGDQFLRYPLKFTRISSVFQTSRFHPVLGVKRPHNGVDFAAPIGTPVRTIGDGRVEIAGARGGAGLMVMIRHSDRYSTAYMHLSKFAPGIKPGAFVKRGQVIGNVGMTGLSTGPHLHFSLYDRGKYVDPLKAQLPTLANNNQSLPKSVLEASMRRLHDAQPMVTLAAADLFGSGKPVA